jgi:imidazolonepropionase-like amidohydrolase
VIALTNISLFNGHADHFCEDASVIFADGEIIYAGPSEGSPAVHEEAQVIDGMGHFVMPGMVESHAHPVLHQQRAS